MRRLSVSLLIVVLLSTVGLGWAIDQLFNGIMQEETDSLQLYRDVGSSLVASSQTAKGLNDVVNTWPDSNPIKLTLINSQEVALPPELKQQMQDGQALELESESGVSLYFAPSYSDDILLLSPPYRRNQTSLQFGMTMLFYAGMICLILLWIYPLARRLLALGRTARAFGEGHLSRRVSTHHHSFLFGIESEFNAMAQRIQSLVADNKMLASAVSHDLRTPLARLRFGIDLLDEAKDEFVRSEYQQRLSNDLTTMENLVEVLLEYARLDQQLNDMPTQSIDLAPIIDNSVESLSDMEIRRIEWVAGQSGFIVDAHAKYVTMMINNLLQNAVNYSESCVGVSIVRKRGKVRLSIEDDGPGIPVEKREDMLKPFVRGKNREGVASGKGYGMGLAIVNRIAQWHNAQFIITDS
ncbi:MAG: two-component sensor histidine kinase, partial [Gammaproteobacteria bacterium]|nr:two-component sensor histidine kinase [Gammaproteobacteria bacterium]